VSTARPRQRPAPTTPGPVVRVTRAWRALSREQRLAAVASLSLWVTMFLPWYSESGLAVSKSGVRTGGITLTAWGAFSWVEAAVLLVSIGVLGLLFARGEQRAFHLPGGDGGVIMLAGGWTTLLVIFRIFDKQSTKTVTGAGAINNGIEWGIFFALFAAIWLTWTGVVIRRAHRAEPALSDDPTVHLQTRPPLRERRTERAAAAARRARVAPTPAPAPAAPRERARYTEEAPRLGHRGVTREDAEQLAFELPDERASED
jgi:hypothetical protein